MTHRRVANSLLMTGRLIAELLVLLCLKLGPLPASALADQPVSPYRNMPWHLVDVAWRLRGPRSFDSLTMDVVILVDPPDQSNVFIVPIRGRVNGEPFYIGCVTRCEGQTAQGAINKGLGRCLMFSRWNQNDPAALRLPPGGHFLISDHEGQHTSLRAPYRWKKGKYTFKVVKLEAAGSEDKPLVWMGAFVYSHDSLEEVYLGALRVPGKSLILSEELYCFIEMFDRDPANLPEKIPQVTAIVGNLKINGIRVEPRSVTAIYGIDVPQSGWARRPEDSMKPLPTDPELIPIGNGSFVFGLSGDEKLVTKEDRKGKLFP